MIADIFVVFIVAIFISLGYKSGLMRSLVKIVSYVLSIIAAFLLFPILSEYLMKTKLYTWIAEKVNESYLSQSSEESLSFFSKYFDGIREGISSSVSELLINIAAFILVLILSKIIMMVVCRVLNVFSKLPIINSFNRLGGAALGGVIGVFVLYLAFAVVVLFAPFESGGKIAAELEKSSFAGEMYENNVLLDLIGKGADIGGANGEG